MSRRILAIDPGTTHSGVILWCPDKKWVQWADQEIENSELRSKLLNGWGSHRIVCEWFQSQGMPVGKEVFETIRFVGRLEEICLARGQAFELIARTTVKVRICGQARAKDPNVRQSLLDQFGPVGTKKQPGPLYGVSGHAWAALALAVAADLT